MKTVVQVVQHLSPGGIEVMALELKKCNQDKARMLIISLEGNKTQAIKKWPRLRAYQNDLIFLDKAPGLDSHLILRLKQIFKDEQVNAVHTHHIGPLIYGGLAARLAGIKELVHTEHDAWHLKNRKRCWLERAIISLTHPTLVADAHTVAQGMTHHLKRKNIYVIKNGIDVEHFCPGNKTQARIQLGLPVDAKVIGSSGRIESVKGHSILINAFRQLPSDIHLAIAGKGSLIEDLKQLAKELGVENRVHLLGQVDDMPNFYQSLDLFCLPSLQEGMPLAPLEAQACGIPAIVTDVGGSAETLCKRTGIVVAPGDSGSLAAALNKLIYKIPEASPRQFIEDSANIKSMASAYAQLCKISGEVA